MTTPNEVPIPKYVSDSMYAHIIEIYKDMFEFVPKSNLMEQLLQKQAAIISHCNVNHRHNQRDCDHKHNGSSPQKTSRFLKFGSGRKKKTSRGNPRPLSISDVTELVTSTELLSSGGRNKRPQSIAIDYHLFSESSENVHPQLATGLQTEMIAELMNSNVFKKSQRKSEHEYNQQQVVLRQQQHKQQHGRNDVRASWHGDTLVSRQTNFDTRL